MDSAEVLEWCQGGHWCVECRQVKGPKSKYRALSVREKEEYEEALLLHKNYGVKNMARLCDAHVTPPRGWSDFVDPWEAGPMRGRLVNPWTREAAFKAVDP